MSSSEDRKHAELLSRVDLFAGLDRLALAKLVAHMDWMRVEDQQEIAREGESGDAMYVVVEGKLDVFVAKGVSEKQVGCLETGHPFGEMSLLTRAPRSATVRARGPAEVLRLERGSFMSLIRDNPEVALSIAKTLSQRLHVAQSGSKARKSYASASTAKGSGQDTTRAAPPWWRSRSTITYLVIAGILALGWLVSPPQGLSIAGWRALIVLLAAVPALAATTIPDGVVALVVATLWVVWGVSTPAEAFGGFATPGWVLVVSVFMIGAAVAASGLLFRTALWTLTHTPGGFNARILSLGVTGLLLGPAAPNATGRISIIAPALAELAQGLGYAPRSRPSAGLAMAAMSGFGQMTTVTMTSSTTAVLAFAVLPAAIRSSINWLDWMIYAAVFNIVIFAVLIVTVMYLFRPHTADTQEMQRASKALALQREVLGKFSNAEKWSAVAIVALLLGFVTQPAHGVHPAWVSVGILAFLAVTGVVNEQALKAVNWSFALLFGVFASMVAVFHSSKVDQWIADLAASAAQGVINQPVLFLLLMALCCFVLTLVLRWQAAAPLAVITLAPVAAAAGIHPVVIAIVAVVACSGFFLPYQSTIYLALYYGSGGDLFTHQQARPIAYAFAGAVLLAIILSVPYWRALGLIS